MSNSKIRHWIYMALGFLILVGCAWFLLLRESKLSEQYLQSEIMAVRQDDLNAVISYLTEKGGESQYHITDLPSIDNSYFGVPNEDSDECRRYNDAVTSLMRTSFSEILYHDGAVRFVTPRSGGILNSNYIVLAYRETAPVLSGAPQTMLKQQDWSYYLITEKE